MLSSDVFRGLVADDENDQSATPQAFAILQFIAVRRLRRGRLTVIDATNVRRQDRRALLHMAGRAHRPAVAILFDTPLEVCLERNRARPERAVEEGVIRDQWAQMRQSTADLTAEGFAEAYLLSELRFEP